MRRILPALFALVCATVSAAPFQNGSFEAGTPTADPCNIPLGIASTAITGWDVIAGNIEWLNAPPGCGWTGSNGTWSLDLVGTGNMGGVAQTFDTIPGRTYRVSFDMAGNPSTLFPPAVKPLTLTLPDGTYGFLFNVSGKSGASMGWLPHARSFVAAGTSSTISFVSDVSVPPFSSSFAGAALDNVRVTLLNSPGTVWTGIEGTVTNTGGPGGTPFPVPGTGGPVIPSNPTVVSDGTGPGPAIFTYATANSYCCHTGDWTFQATASTPGDLTLDWAYAGYHGTCQSWATLTAFISRGGFVVHSDPVYEAFDAGCAGAPPSGGFDQQGTVTLPALQVGDTYGFVMTASNYDLNGGVLGRLEVSPSAPVVTVPELIRALPLGSAVIPLLIGRLDGAPSAPVTVRLYGGTTCTNGVLGGTVAQIGLDASVTTDPAGYFGTLQGGTQGQFVAIDVVTPSGVTPVSACLVSVADNDTWPKALRLEGDSVTMPADYIDAPGKARWYRFSVLPGQSIQVTLAGLPADYDLAVFKDIATEFANELVPATTEQLTKLSAQYAPSAFSPSAFSPSAFSPSAFSPSAFSPSAFSPSAFSPSAFSPSAFSDPGSAPSAFSTEELAQAFSSAQTRSIVAASMTPGTGNESVLVNTWNNTGDFYVRVTGRAAASSTLPYTLTVAKQGMSCTGITRLIPTTRTAGGSTYNTIILVDSTVTPLTAPVAGGSLQSKLDALAARPEVNGVVVDVGLDGRVIALKTQANDKAGCPFARNLVAYEIKTIVDAYLLTNPLKYVVIVGNDDAVPFFRYPDQTLLGPESGFVPPVKSSSASEASLRNNFVLGQDAYGAPTHISTGVSSFPIPGLAVGRLLETPQDIAGLIDAFIATNGVLSPTSSLVTGYDFLQDAAEAIRDELQAGIGVTPDTLITPNTVSPANPNPYAVGGPWTAADLRQKLLYTRHDVIFLAGHFNANSALAADFKTSMVTSELAASSVLTNALVFSAGCHSGYNIVDADAIYGVTFPLDWAQALAQKQATLIAGTGYQYGDTDFLEYSERLYLNFAKELRAGSGNVAIGEALVRAKHAYLAATPDVRGLHEKAVLQTTLFGLPMLAVNMPTGRTSAPSTIGAITPTLVPSGPASTLGLHVADLPPVSPALTTNTRVLKNYDVQPPATVTATWLSGPDGILTNPADPALPLKIVNVTPTIPTLVLRGVGLRGATYSDSTVFPLTGAPTSELRGVHTPFSSPVFYPMRLWTTNYFNALAGGGGTNLIVTPAQHRALDPTNSTLRQYSNLSLRLYYSNLATSTNSSDAKPSLSDAPTIVRADAVVNGGLATFSAQVLGNPLAAIHEVWVTHTGGAGGSGTWTSVNLQQCVAPLPAACGSTADSRVWKARVAAASLLNAKFIVQAVNGVGLVSLDDNLGRYYSVGIAAPLATSIAFSPPVPTSAVYGDIKSITASLSAGGSPVAGKLVTVSIGGAARIGTTNAAGSVTVQVPMLSTPGTYPLAASFGGDDAFAPASVTAALPVTITRAATTLATPTSGVGAVLTASVGGSTQPLIHESIRFLITGPQGGLLVGAITDYTGRATIPPPGLPPGTYSVVQACFPGSATYAPAQLSATPSCSIFGFVLHGTGATVNPATLYLDRIPATAQTAMSKDSPAVNFNNGNPWKDIGVWNASPERAGGPLAGLAPLQVWLGLVNSDDQGTQFDLQAILKKNGVELASGITRCITGLTRNAAQAKLATVTFPALSTVKFNGSTDVLTLQLRTRIGTNPNDTKCPGPGGSHNNAVGLRLYFNALTRDSYFGTAPP